MDEKGSMFDSTRSGGGYEAIDAPVALTAKVAKPQPEPNASCYLLAVGG